MPELQAARGLNLHKLPAKAALMHRWPLLRVVERRSYLQIWLPARAQSSHNRRRSRTNRIRLYLPRSSQVAHGACHIGFEHQNAPVGRRDTVATINAGGFRQRNRIRWKCARREPRPATAIAKVYLRPRRRRPARICNRGRIWRNRGRKVHCLFSPVRMVGGISPKRAGFCAVTLVVLRKRGPGGKIHDEP